MDNGHFAQPLENTFCSISHFFPVGNHRENHAKLHRPRRLQGNGPYEYILYCLVFIQRTDTRYCACSLYKNQAIQYVFGKAVFLQTVGPVGFGVIFPVVADGKKV